MRRARVVHSALERHLVPTLAALLVCLLTGCMSPDQVARHFLDRVYQDAILDRGEVLHDVPYAIDARATSMAASGLPAAESSAPGPHHPRQVLDFYRPGGSGWPMMVFVHGGSFVDGGKDLAIGGADIYGNVGRFYAAHGIGVAVIDYRLQPEVHWPDQVDDVAYAAAWAAGPARRWGASGKVILVGHSAGAWLVSRVALDPVCQSHAGLDARAIAGVVAISGSGYDLRDDLTWELFGQRRFWAKRFDPGNGTADWKSLSSVVSLLADVDASAAPPFLLIHSQREWAALQRQNSIFFHALRHARIEVERFAVPGGGHRRTVLALSRAGHPISERVLDLIAATAPAPRREMARHTAGPAGT